MQKRLMVGPDQLLWVLFFVGIVAPPRWLKLNQQKRQKVLVTLGWLVRIIWLIKLTISFFSVPSFGLSNKVSGPAAIEQSINTVQEYLRELEKTVIGPKTDEERFRVLEITLDSMRDNLSGFYEKVRSNKEIQQSKANKELRQSLFNLKVELDSVNAIIADKANKGLPKKETEVIFKRVFDALNQEKGATKNTQLTSSPIYGWLIWLFSGSFVLGFLVYESVSMMKEVEAIMKWKNKGKSILSFGSKLCVKLFHQHSLRVSWFWGHNATIA